MMDLQVGCRLSLLLIPSYVQSNLLISSIQQQTAVKKSHIPIALEDFDRALYHHKQAQNYNC